MITRIVALLLAAAALPGVARAEVVALAAGSSDGSAAADPAAARVAALATESGYDLAPVEEVLEATGGPLTAEPTASTLEGWAAALEADLVISIFVEPGAEGATVRVAVHDGAARESRAGSDAANAEAPIADVAARLVEELLPPRQEPTPPPEPAHEEGSATTPGDEDAETISEVVAVDDGSDPAPAPPPLPEPEAPRDARLQFALNSTALGFSVMTGVLLTADVRDPRLFAPMMLVGGGGGLAVALLVERRWSISQGDNSIVGVGGWWGGALGVLVAGAAGGETLRWLGAGGLAGQLLGLGAGITAAAYTEVSAGDGAVIHSGAVWGLFTGGVLATLVRHDDLRASYGMVLASLFAGLGAGVLTAQLTEISAGRAAIIDLCGLLGVLLGASVGTPIIIDSQSDGHLRAYAGVLLGSAAVGIGLGTLLTRNWDRRADRQEGGGDRPRALLRRRAASLPVLAPAIIPPAEGVVGSRAAIGLQLVGGAL